MPQEKTLESIYEQWQPVAFELKPWKAMPWTPGPGPCFTLWVWKT